VSYRNIRALIDYGRAAEFERMADLIEFSEPYELGQDICKTILFLFAAIHPDVRDTTVDALLKAETNQEMLHFEDEHEQNDETDS
jgi:hypothetical protein